MDNNVWLVGDDDEVIVIDAAHDAEAILAAVGGRRLAAVVCTHGHNDHINAARQVGAAAGAPVLLHPGDQMLWDLVHAGRAPGRGAGGGPGDRPWRGRGCGCCTRRVTPPAASACTRRSMRRGVLR